MNRTLYCMCIAALVPISACSEPPQQAARAVADEDGATVAAPAEVSDRDPLCGVLEGGIDYEPVPALGPDFADSFVDVLGVKGRSRVLYASQPREIELSRGDATVQLVYELDANEEFQLTTCFALPQVGGAYAYVGPIGSQGGQHPMVTEIFMANADADPGQELVVLVAWKIESALGTSGTMFEPYVFDAPEDAGVMERVELQDPALSFGFDGVREGEQVSYPFKDAQAFRTRLRELGY